MTSTAISAFDLLEGDVNGQKEKQLREALLDMKYRIKKSMDQGLSSADFEVAKVLLGSVDSAEEALERIVQNVL